MLKVLISHLSFIQMVIKNLRKKQLLIKII